MENKEITINKEKFVEKCAEVATEEATKEPMIMLVSTVLFAKLMDKLFRESEDN
jgi:hypothetical protein